MPMRACTHTRMHTCAHVPTCTNAHMPPCTHAYLRACVAWVHMRRQVMYAYVSYVQAGMCACAHVPCALIHTCTHERVHSVCVFAHPTPPRQPHHSNQSPFRFPLIPDAPPLTALPEIPGDCAPGVDARPLNYHYYHYCYSTTTRLQLLLVLLLDVLLLLLQPLPRRLRLLMRKPPFLLWLLLRTPRMAHAPSHASPFTPKKNHWQVDRAFLADA